MLFINKLSDIILTEVTRDKNDHNKVVVLDSNISIYLQALQGIGMAGSIFNRRQISHFNRLDLAPKMFRPGQLIQHTW
jgi:hypothetical protein